MFGPDREFTSLAERSELCDWRFPIHVYRVEQIERLSSIKWTKFLLIYGLIALFHLIIPGYAATGVSAGRFANAFLRLLRLPRPVAKSRPVAGRLSFYVILELLIDLKQLPLALIPKVQRKSQRHKVRCLPYRDLAAGSDRRQVSLRGGLWKCKENRATNLQSFIPAVMLRSLFNSDLAQRWSFPQPQGHVSFRPRPLEQISPPAQKTWAIGHYY